MARETFSGRVQRGQFISDDPVRFAGRMAHLEGRRVRASFRRETTGRTMSQNKYYWKAVVGTIGEWSGYDVNSKEDRDRLHDGLKRKHLGEETVNGLVLALPSRSRPCCALPGLAPPRRAVL